VITKIGAFSPDYFTYYSFSLEFSELRLQQKHFEKDSDFFFAKNNDQMKFVFGIRKKRFFEKILERKAGLGF
jgi:hypothetical protein